MKLLGLLILVNLTWAHDTPQLVKRYELWTWVNSGQVEKSIITELPTKDKPFGITKDATIGDEIHAKVRACDDKQCSDWSNQADKVVTETQVITITKPTDIIIEIKVQ